MQAPVVSEKLSPHFYPFYLYVLMFLFIITADGIMSYQVPVAMDRALGNTTLMGAVLATSSFFGTFFDFFFAKMFANKKSVFFNKILIASVFFFPLSFLVYQIIPSFVFGMFMWGLYYEAIVFSNYHAIHEYVHPKDHLWAWGTLVIVKNIGWVIGPILAGLLDSVDPRHPFYAAIGFYSVGTLLFAIRRILMRIHKPRFSHTPEPQSKHSFRAEIAIWRVYARSFWPLLVLFFLFFLIDSTFFSIGPVFSESLQELHPYGGLFISMYTLPTALFVAITGVLAKQFGKKRSAFLGGIVGGIGLMVMSQMTSVPAILATTFFATIGISIMYPELTAVFEDFVSRAKHFGNDIIGLTAIMGSIGYVVGPLTNGILADLISPQKVFGLWGAILVTFSIICFFIVKRKVRLPTQEAEIAFEEIEGHAA